MTSWMRPGTRVSEGLTQLGRDGGSSCAKGTVKLTPKGIEERRKLVRATILCGSLGASDLGPDREALGACGPVLGGGDVIATEVEEVADLVMGGEEPLCLAG